MSPLDAIRIAWRNLLEGRVFFIANVIAIAVGVFLVVIMLSLANGIRAYAEQLLRRDVGANTIEVSFDRRTGSAAPLTNERLRALGEIPGVGAVTPIVQGVFAELRGGGPEALISLWSTTGANDPEVARYAYGAGSPAKLTANAILINEAVAAEMQIFPLAKLPGRKVSLRITRSGPQGEETREIPLVIAAVARQTRFSRCYVPLATMEEIWRWQNRVPADAPFVYETALVYTRTVDDVTSVRKNLESRGYRTGSILDTLRQYREATRFIAIALGSLGGIALFTGAMSIFNAAWAAVMRRMKEFAVYKSYGATRRSLVSIVLLEALMTAAVAASIGFLAAWGGGIAIRRFITKDFDFNLFPVDAWLLLIAFGVAAAACLGASAIPAMRAADLPPGETLRAG